MGFEVNPTSNLSMVSVHNCYVGSIAGVGLEYYLFLSLKCSYLISDKRKEK